MTNRSAKKFTDHQIISCWEKNTQPWIAAIQNNQIKSRTIITNQAILDVIDSKQPKSVLDIGCGEGWLCRALAAKGISALGIDVIPEFIAYAKQLSSGRFQCIAYEELSYEYLNEHFDMLICNFSLFGKTSVEHVFLQASKLLKTNGHFIIQTIHPDAIESQTDSTEGWRAGSWQGFSSDFSDPAPWYFRSTENWLQLFQQNGFQSIEVVEPHYPNTQALASIIFCATNPTMLNV